MVSREGDRDTTSRSKEGGFVNDKGECFFLLGFWKMSCSIVGLCSQAGFVLLYVQLAQTA